MLQQSLPSSLLWSWAWLTPLSTGKVWAFSPKCPTLGLCCTTQYLYTDSPAALWLDLSPEVVSLLLLKGCDPNQSFVDESGLRTTPWQSWVTDMQFFVSGHPACVIAEVTMYFLKAGAYLYIEVGESHVSLESIIRRRILGRHLDVQEIGSDVGISRDKRVLISLCDDILDFIALRRAARDTNTLLSGQSLLVHQPGPETGTTDTPLASRLATPMKGNARRTSRRHLSSKSARESDGGVGVEAGSAMKKRKYDVAASADEIRRSKMREREG